MATAVQSATLNQILDAVENLLNYGDGTVPGLGIDSAYIQEAYSGYRPRSGEPYEVTFGLVKGSPVLYHGGGRKGHDTFLTLQVRVYTRLETDVAGSDKQWSRDANLGALVMTAKVEDIFQDAIIYGNYDPITHLPLGNPLVVEHVQQVDNPGPDKPATGQSDRGEDVGGYGVNDLFFSMKIAAALTTSSS